MKPTKPTHQFTNAYGKIYFGTPVSNTHFLPMCDDHKTWMKEPVYIGNCHICHIVLTK